ncbi:hypothetical protein T07_4753 [Trichinella nelsoni]|uniref:Uncharacterized protein n=1 Tax=Trichinella nelsoni TaxID=6336 RepID=A0A0V0RDL8_9BILA|nr:hypothetical protein T07_4753 [Trichinella nelsoni]
MGAYLTYYLFGHGGLFDLLFICKHIVVMRGF